MPVCGAMDIHALQVANLLVGNTRGAACLEVAMGGLSLRALQETTVAICGADLEARLDGEPAPTWKSFTIRHGQELIFGHAIRGVWAYFAVAGGIDVPPVMGSRSTYLRGALGGLAGRTLAKGDILCADEPPSTGAVRSRGLMTAEIPRYQQNVAVRVVLGPQQEAFEDESVRSFLESEYKVTAQSDRMGYRLRGPELRHRVWDDPPSEKEVPACNPYGQAPPLRAKLHALHSAADILSDALTFGSIQVPADGQPIVLMADHQTTGGYAKIATVISADLSALAQVAPGGKVQFQAVDVEQAQSLARQRESFLSRLAVACA